MLTHMPLNVSGIGAYPDILAFLFVCIITCLMIIGVKESAMANRIFTLLNVAALSFIIVAGATKSDISNWNLQVNSNTSWTNSEGLNKTCSSEKEKCGTGGYIPFGLTGVLNGAAKCFFAFVGFDAIASTGEEVVRPERNIPLGILITLIIVSVLYCGLSGVLSLMMPFYMVNAETPLPQAFKYVHLEWATILVSMAAIFSLSTCMYGIMFPLPRVSTFYSKANMIK